MLEILSFIEYTSMLMIYHLLFIGNTDNKIKKHLLISLIGGIVSATLFIIFNSFGTVTIILILLLSLIVSCKIYEKNIIVNMVEIIIASIVLNKDVVKEALDQILFRTSSTHGEIELSMLSVIKSNILVTLDSIPLKMITLLLIAWLIVFILYKKKSGEIIKSVSILLIALMPIAWYIVLKNHSSIHCWFTYRSLSVSIFALMSFLFFAIDEEKIKIKFNNKNFYS